MANQPNTNIDKVTDFLNQRNTSAPSRINDIIEQHIAPTDYIEQRQTTLNNLKSPEIKGAYQAAYDSVPSINDPEVNQTLDRLISTDVGRKAWQQAFQAATLDGRTLGPVDATGSLRSVSTYGIDQFKQQLDSTIRSEATNGNFDKMSPLGSKITNLKNQLVNRVDEINPIYGQARAQYGDEASLINAGDTGYKDIWSNKPGTAARIYDQFHNNMTPPEQQALLSGVARKIQEMGKVQAGDNPLPNTANPAKNIVNNPQVRERLTALLGDKPVGKFIDDMSTQAGMQDIANKILSNSATARRQAVQQDFAEKTASPLEKLRPLARYGSEFEALNPFTWIGINRKSVEQMGANASAANRSQIGSDVLGRLLNPDYSSNMKTLGALMNDPAKRASALAAYARLAGQGNNLITNALPRASNLLVSPQTQPQ